MTQTRPLTLKDIVRAAWRRRWLFATAFLVLLPLSAIFAKFQPKPYVAHSLLLLQETGRDTLLSKNSDVPSGSMQERINGLQALLKSNHVLTTSVRQILGDETPSDPRQLAYLVKDLDEALSLTLVGNEFIEFQLKGTNPQGLGKKLETVMLTLMETLMSDQNTTSAAQLLIERRRDELRASEKTFAELKAIVDARWTLRPQKLQDVEKLKQQLDEKSTALKAVIGERDAARQALEGSAAAATPITDQIQLANAEVQRLSSSGGTSSPEYQLATRRATQLHKIDDLEKRAGGLQTEIDTTKAAIKQTGTEIDEAVSLKGKLAVAEEQVRSKRAQFEVYSKRYAALPSGQLLTVLNAPERMKMIDPPRDPEIPETTGSRYLLAGLLASILLPASLAVLAEMFDTTLRRESDFVEATGAPVLARLPPITLADSAGDWRPELTASG